MLWRSWKLLFPPTLILSFFLLRKKHKVIDRGLNNRSEFECSLGYLGMTSANGSGGAGQLIHAKKFQPLPCIRGKHCKYRFPWFLIYPCQFCQPFLNLLLSLLKKSFPKMWQPQSLNMVSAEGIYWILDLDIAFLSTKEWILTWNLKPSFGILFGIRGSRSRQEVYEKQLVWLQHTSRVGGKIKLVLTKNFTNMVSKSGQKFESLTQGTNCS